MFDQILFSVLPYVVLAVGVVASLWRYFSHRYKFSSLSSQFLESQQLFWSSVPWHYGILIVLTGHLVGFLFPADVLLWNSVPARLLVLEVTALLFGLLALIGLVLLIWRRATNPRIRVVTTRMDVIVLIFLLVQVLSGVGTAVFLRWGSSWYAAALVPYLRSLFTLSPNLESVKGLHWLVKIHIVNAFLLVGMIPFTRLVHFLILPVSYLWRPYQLVIWNANQRRLRRTERDF